MQSSLVAYYSKLVVWGRNEYCTKFHAGFIRVPPEFCRHAWMWWKRDDQIENSSRWFKTGVKSRDSTKIADTVSAFRRVSLIKHIRQTTLIKRKGIYRKRIWERQTFKPIKEHRPVRVNTLNNNTKYCEMTATIKKDKNEIQQFGPKSPLEKLLQRQPEWVRKSVIVAVVSGSNKRRKIIIYLQICRYYDREEEMMAM